MSTDGALIERLSGGLGEALAEALLPGEELRGALAGLPGQGIALTDKRVIILKAGSASGAMFGRKAKAYPLKAITSVEISCGLTQGRIQVTVAGAVEQQHGWMSKAGWLDQVAAAQQSETSCQFPARKKQVFQRLAAMIQEAIV